MTNLVSRQAQPSSAPAAMANAIAGVTGQLPDVLQLCNAVAAAGEMLPRAYQGKPGAVLLAKMWADQHGVDLFTAIQNIDIIDGKPWVKTQMRIELAVNKGFEFRVTESSVERCTVEVWRHGKRVGDPITACFDDRPRRLKTNKGAPTPWALHPDDMLFAEACRKADRRYVRTAAGMIDAEQDYQSDDDSDPVDVIHSVDVDEAPVESPPVAADQPQVMDGGELRELISHRKSRSVTVPKALRAVQARWPDGGFADLDRVAADDQALDFVLGWIEQEGNSDDG